MTIPLYCTDYDNGIKTENSSWVEFTQDGISVETEYDSCADSKTVLEWYCFGNQPESIEVTCSDVCSGGRCVSGTTSTTTTSTTTSTSTTTTTSTSTTSTTTTLPIYTATAARTLPGTAEPGSRVNVTLALDVNETNKPNSIIIKDYFPASWDVKDSEPEAESVNPVEGEIRWILVEDGVFDRNISYVVKVPLDEIGNKTFSGELLYNDPEGSPVNASIGGDSVIRIEGECPKGDANCDGTVSDFELLDYIDLWVQGEVSDFDLLEAIDNWASR